MNNLSYSEFNFIPKQNIYNNNNTFDPNIIDKFLLDNQSKNYIIKKLINNNLLFSILYKLFNFDIELLTTLCLGMLIVLLFRIISN